MLLDVIGALGEYRGADAAKARMAEIKGKIGETYFAWSGPTAEGVRPISACRGRPW